MSHKYLLLGDEALAQGAIDAGLTGAYAYPGTPSTEILEYIQLHCTRTGESIHHAWSANEKTAMEEALGVAYAGKRALVSMKHVGLNVAADPFMNAAVTGVNGGLVIAVCDDPSMHSSQNEQDSRFFAKFAMIPVLEPANQQEAYELTRRAFDLSEEVRLPVMVRLTTRLAHSRADVVTAGRRAQNPLSLPPDNRQYILIPANARRNYAALVAKQGDLLARAEDSPDNRWEDGKDTSLGILATGIAVNYLREAYGGEPCPHPVLSVRHYPLPGALVRRLADTCDALMILEEGMPLVEEAIRGVLPSPLAIHGRLDGTLPRLGELSPDCVAQALGIRVEPGPPVSPLVAARPPRLCQGCAHAGSFGFLKAALQAFPETRVLSDIGCYALGALSPYEAIDTCVDMGASITMAKGVADAGLRPAIAVIGDSTFTHSGITGLLDCVIEKTPVTVLILDNDTTAMTGGQESAGEGQRIDGICLGLGVEPEHLHVVDPLPSLIEANTELLKRELAYEGVSVIISRRVCIQALKKRRKEAAG